MGHKEHLHILGIGGTFMGSLALLAKALGYHVTGSDGPLYPPMSDILKTAKIPVYMGYDTDILDVKPAKYIIGNALKRGMPIVEALLNNRFPLISGPEWLAKQILSHKTRVLGVAGTHGKTTTSSLLAWILLKANYNPGFLIGGLSEQLGQSARLGGNAPDGHRYFVLECDEYDSAFFDKRSKFIHYRPTITILNNIEFDHADIFSDLRAIETQFHHLIRTLPSQGHIIAPFAQPSIDRVLAQGCWTPVSYFTTQTIGLAQNTKIDWRCQTRDPDGSHWELQHQGQSCGILKWSLLGQHNQHNALAAIAAAAQVGISPQQSLSALSEFMGVKRRLEVRYSSPQWVLYDDFAHHPTAMAFTLSGLRAKVGNAPIMVVVDIRSNTMQKGTHRGQFKSALASADAIFFYQGKAPTWDVAAEFATLGKPGGVYHSIPTLLDAIKTAAKQQHATPVHLLGMSNGDLEALYAHAFV